jgi:hypothetical protein
MFFGRFSPLSVRFFRVKRAVPTHLGLLRAGLGQGIKPASLEDPARFPNHAWRAGPKTGRASPDPGRARRPVWPSLPLSLVIALRIPGLAPRVSASSPTSPTASLRRSTSCVAPPPRPSPPSGLNQCWSRPARPPPTATDPGLGASPPSHLNQHRLSRPHGEQLL